MNSICSAVAGIPSTRVRLVITRRETEQRIASPGQEYHTLSYSSPILVRHHRQYTPRHRLAPGDNTWNRVVERGIYYMVYGTWYIMVHGTEHGICYMVYGLS